MRVPILAAASGLLVVLSAAGADEGLGALKDLCLQTVLVQGGKAEAVIVAPEGQDYGDIAALLRAAVAERTGVALPIRTPAAVDDELLRASHILLIGNAPDNDLVRRLVWERRLLDTWYPGDERFVVRSLHNPFGYGRNIVFIGGENPSRVRAAAETFLSRLVPGEPLAIGWIMTFETERRGAAVSAATLADAEAKAAQARGFKNGRTLISSAASAARRYYDTGQEGWARVFLTYMTAHQALNEPGMGTHMNVYDTIATWDLIEESPVFTDEDRLRVTNHFLYILRSAEGCNHAFFRKGTKTPGVRHNHQTLPGLACQFGGRYFQIGYALPEAAEWLQAGKALFDSQKVSSKPQCDCNCYEWGTLDQTASWSLAARDDAFFTNGSMRGAADRALLEMDNRGCSACNGDFWALDYFPETLFKQAAAFYRDGRYEWAIRKRYAGRSEAARRGAADQVRGLEPQEPTDLLGIRVAPMSPHFYEAPGTTMPDEPRRNIPLAQSFDKMSFRRTFDPEDQYLLLDGIGCGSHGHVDVNGVSHFTDNGRLWLMDVSYTEAPNLRDHNAVTILRDGVTVPPPPLAALDPAHGTADLDTCGFATTSLPEYCGTDWQRHILWAKERYFLFIDEVVAREPGMYTMRSHWRTPGAGRLDGLTFTVSQQARAPQAPAQQITRPDAEGDGRCMKLLHADGALGKKVRLAPGRWNVTVVGCGHDPGDDSFYLHLDGRQVAAVSLSNERMAPAEPVALDIATAGEHEIKLTLRERGGTICDRIILAGPDAATVVLDALDLEIIRPPPGRIDTFTLQNVGADQASLVLDTSNVGHWFEPYPYTDAVASIVQFTASRELQPGARHCFANVFAVSNPEEPVSVQVRGLADGVVLVRDGERIACAGIGPATFRLGETEVSAQAQQFLLSADRIAVRQGTRVTWRGGLLTAPTATSVETALTEGRAARAADLEKAWAAAPPPTTVPSAAQTRGLQVAWTASTGSAVLALAQGDVDGDGTAEVAVGSADKCVRLLDPAGRPRWSFETAGKVNSVAIADLDADGKGEVIAGSDDRRCYVLNHDGTERWHFEGEAGDDPYWRRYWKAGEVEKVLAADIDGDGKREVIFAAANMNVHACDVTGKRLWRFTQYGVCTSLLAADLTGDGAMEVIGGPAEITCHSTCSVLDRNGKSVSSYGNDGWASALTAICTVDLDGNGAPTVVCGTNMNNIHALNALQGKLAPRWRAAAGDVVTGLCAARSAAGSPPGVIAGSASGYVHAFDRDGKAVWTTHVQDPVRAVAARDLDGDGLDEVLAATARVVFILDAQGAVAATFAAGGDVLAMDCAGSVLVGQEDGAVQSLRLAP